VVHGEASQLFAGKNEGLDELTTTGRSHFARVQKDSVEFGVLDATDFGLLRVDLKALAGGATAMENARMIEAILDRQDQGPRREIVLLNAAAALVVAGVARDLQAGLAGAVESVDSGAALAVLTRLRAFGVRNL
jgi:anthranilate phosphoribosyltransferase